MNQILELRPGDLSVNLELESLMETVRKNAGYCNTLIVNLEHTTRINLSQFNTLVVLYVSLARAGKKLSFENSTRHIKRFIDKTNFHHVFDS